MKHILTLILILTLSPVFAQTGADDIVGRWLKIPKEDLIIEVFKSNDQYKGKIEWSSNQEKKPNGYLILQKLAYNDQKHFWEHGKITDPSSGKSYNAAAKIKPDGTLEVEGYMGVKLLGSKRYFKRIK
ncbi:MAG: DUF2147 domain-containing protein [Chitinophagaceae bacterium]|nr:MAG: DUF2147 domain-containing protein [Chitinophagaceae bacterium]